MKTCHTVIVQTLTSFFNIMFESFDNPNLCVVGDLNTNDNNFFGNLLKSFCLNYDLNISNQEYYLITTDT